MLDPSFLDRIRGTGSGAGATFEIRSPIDGRIVAAVPDCGAAEARQALDRAVTGFDRWKRTTAYERAAVMKKWHGPRLKGG